jgi:ferredoxin, 2Fe-2S
MPTITFIEDNGSQHVVQAETGRSLMQAAMDNDVPGIVADCGGCCSCGTCHCFVEAEATLAVPAPQSAELAMLEGLLELRPSSRLACQIDVTAGMDGLTVYLPTSQF